MLEENALLIAPRFFEKCPVLLFHSKAYINPLSFDRFNKIEMACHEL
jgi:hypothetical protein